MDKETYKQYKAMLDAYSEEELKDIAAGKTGMDEDTIQIAKELLREKKFPKVRLATDPKKNSEIRMGISECTEKELFQIVAFPENWEKETVMVAQKELDSRKEQTLVAVSNSNPNWASKMTKNCLLLTVGITLSLGLLLYFFFSFLWALIENIIGLFL